MITKAFVLISVFATIAVPCDANYFILAASIFVAGAVSIFVEH